MHAPVLRDVDSLRRYLKSHASATPLQRTDGRPTGLPPLDRLLEGGVPKGAITVLTGVAGTGRMSIAARLLAEETRALKPVAWVDAKKTLYPPALVQAGVDLQRLLVVRGAGQRALFAIEQIVESGAFGIVIASGIESFLSQAGLRRVQAASEAAHASTILVLEPQASALVTNAALKLRVSRRSPGLQVEVEKSRGDTIGRRAFIELAA